MDRRIVRVLILVAVAVLAIILYSRLRINKALPPDCPCSTALPIRLNMTMSTAPDVCASRIARTQLAWTATDGSQLSEISIPDPPYRGSTCSGTSCGTGTFTGQNLPDCTKVGYSLRMTNAASSKVIYGHIIIKP
jgi:hypothetical protein